LIPRLGAKVPDKQIIPDNTLGDGNSLARGFWEAKHPKDVLGLDAIHVPRVPILSNKISEHQVAKVALFAKALATG
jgi:hypothetical protein